MMGGISVMGGKVLGIRRERDADGGKRPLMSLLLVLAAVIWGAAFVAQSEGTRYVGPFTFVAVRYFLSALVLLPLSLYTGRKSGPAPLTRGELKTAAAGGTVCGVFLALASLAQQAGIETTTAGKAGFITALYVVLVPVFGLVLGQRPTLRIWICVGLGLLGLYLISVKAGFRIERGDALMILCAALFSCQILSVDHFTARLSHVILLADIQFWVTALISAAGMLIRETPDLAGIRAAAVPILYAGVMSGAVGYTLQILGQKYTDPAIASLIMSLESVFSALTGWLILHQTLSARELAGCAVLFLAVIAAQLPAAGRKGRGPAPFFKKGPL